MLAHPTHGREAGVHSEANGTYTGYNPLPDPTAWSLSMPGGVAVAARGKVSLLRVSVQPKENRLWVDYAAKPGQDGPEMARDLLVTGLKRRPVVNLNGELTDAIDTVETGGRSAYLVPLFAKLPSPSATPSATTSPSRSSVH